ncbi:MAG TPA: DUF881 domain-containing protein [Symbiobacteriaceae bacterium]|nr:DUF881 domain-containing protein [Symbiobacteriaceae bacterium]
MHRTKWALGLVMTVFGLLVTTQFRTTTTQQSTDPSKLRAEELSASLKASEEALKASEAARKKLESENKRLQEAVNTVTPPPSEEKHLKGLVGATTLKGPGVAVTVSVSDTSSTKARVSDEDIWRVVNELLSAGAEGIAVSGQRLGPLTPIRNVGNRIMVGQTLISAPVEVVAIGDPKVLEAAILLRGGVQDVLARWGLKATVQKVESVELPPLKSLPSFTFAKPQT